VQAIKRTQTQGIMSALVDHGRLRFREKCVGSSDEKL
jgi:hypothetical protein